MVNSLKIKIKEFGTKKLILVLIILLLSLLIVFSFFRRSTNKDFINTSNHIYDYQSTSNQIAGKDNYTNKYLQYKDSNLKFINKDIKFNETDYVGTPVTSDNENYDEILSKYKILNTNATRIFYLDETIDLKVNVGDIDEGIYYLGFDFLDNNDQIENNQYQILINDEIQFHESRTLVLPSRWDFLKTDFSTDRYGNEIQPGATKIKEWIRHDVYDYNGLNPGLYGFHIKPNDTITIKSTNNDLVIGNVYSVKQEDLISYDSYLNKHSNENIVDDLIKISARDMLSRSEPAIRLRSEQNPTNMYYNTQKLMLSTIFDASWMNGGQKVAYEINTEEAGMYSLSFKYRQPMLNGMSTFRKIEVNGEVPFDLFESYAFPHESGFVNRKVVDSNNNDIKVYLNKGVNTISLEAVSYPYRTGIEKTKDIMADIQSLSLKIKNYTGGNSSLFQDWDIEKDFPEAQGDLYRWADELDELHASLKQLSKESNPSEISNLKQASKRLRALAKNINKLPSKMLQFSDGDSSVSQLLGATMQRLMMSGLELESFTVSNNTKIEKPYANIFVSLYEGTKRLILSYVNNPYSTTNKNKEDLNVWVNHPRQYIEIMQAMIDEKYPGSRRITLSQMPDQNKLILANASGTAPDVAVGVDHWIPYDFAIREAALDLRQFEGYADLMTNFAPGALMPYIFEDGVYGLPETQNFWVTYYRKDVLENIGVTEVPQTWEEVKALLPLLQSYKLNYFIPLSQFVGLKPFAGTLPFIDQFGGSLYSEDGMTTAIGGGETLEGMKLMSELFTLYNMPKYIASFYNQFRYGLIPIGVSDLSTYILLETTALELDGLWDIDLHPGNYNSEKDEILRYAPSGGQSSMIMSTTKYQQESWEFLNWWMSTEIQSEFAFTLQNTYGKAYFWNTANLSAFNTLSMSKKHREVILKQWEYASEAPRIPGSYMVEREISNAWTKMVFDGANPRFSLDEAVRISNREIAYKMAEFGYVKNGVKVKDYPVPTLENVDYWLTEVSR